ncbi:MAG: tetratricopeptide repeat protein [Methanomassiliicoccales archaeon]
MKDKRTTHRVDATAFRKQCASLLQKMGIEHEGCEARRGYDIYRGRRKGERYFVIAMPQAPKGGAKIGEMISAAQKLGEKVVIISPAHLRAFTSKRGVMSITGTKFEESVNGGMGKEEEILKTAEALFRQGKFEEAAHKLTSVEYADDRRFHMLLGRIMLRLGRYEEAREYFQLAVSIEESEDALLGLADAYMRLGNREEEIECCDRLLSISPGNSDALRRKAAALQMLGRTEEAINCYRQITSADPRDEEAWRNMAMAYFRMGNVEQSVAILDERIGQGDDEARLLKDMILIRRADAATRQDSDEVPEDKKDASLLTKIKENGLLTSEGGVDRCIRFLHALGTEEAAAALCELLSGAESGSLYFMEMKEKMVFERGEFGEAELLARLLLARKFDNEYRRRIAASLAFQGKYREALEFTEGMEDPVSVSFRQACLLHLKSTEPLPTPAIDNFSSTENNRAVGFLIAGKRTEAESIFRQILPSISAANNLAVLHHLEGRSTEAASLLSSPSNLKNWVVAGNLGTLLFEKEKYEEAAKLLPEAVAHHNTAELRNMLGVALAESGRYDEAGEQFRRAVQIEPEFKKAKKNLRRLNKMLRA